MSEFLGLNFSLKGMFQSGFISGDDQDKTGVFFGAIGDMNHIDPDFLENYVIACLYKIKRNLFENKVGLLQAASALNECIKRAGGIDNFINLLRFTATGMIMRDACMAHNMLERMRLAMQGISAICVVGDVHLEGINARLKNECPGCISDIQPFKKDIAQFLA